MTLSSSSTTKTITGKSSGDNGPFNSKAQEKKSVKRLHHGMVVIVLVVTGLAVAVFSVRRMLQRDPDDADARENARVLTTTTIGSGDTIASNNETSPSPTTAPSFTSPTLSLEVTNEPSSSPTQFPSTRPSEDEINEWLAATVTLQDGAQFQVLSQLYHDNTAFTQGLTFANGVLYESTGLRRKSSIRQLDPNTGAVEVNVPLPAIYFGEGLTFYDDTLIQITYTRKKGFVYNATNLWQAPTEFNFDTTTGQGWGITYDMIRNELIVSDGSNLLHFWDPTELGQSVRTIPVTRQSGQPAIKLNELEFWRGRVLANVWYEDVLLVIHPETGVVEKEYNFASLWPHSERPSGANVFNGISVSQKPNVLYVTGKKWDRMYKIKLLP